MQDPDGSQNPEPTMEELWAMARSEAGGAAPPPSPAAGSETLNLLLDVELPVSVSFGRTEMPLQDVLKLTAGSVIELDRTVSEPVEVIVNNCVIALGEVVVIDGNYGVRIQRIVSREQRLASVPGSRTCAGNGS